MLVVNRMGEAWLVVSELEAAPSDQTYEAWVIEDGDAVPAGLFHGGGSRTIVKLSRQVPDRGGRRGHPRAHRRRRRADGRARLRERSDGLAGR
jgi:hypothetical protein